MMDCLAFMFGIGLFVRIIYVMHRQYLKIKQDSQMRILEHEEYRREKEEFEEELKQYKS